MHLVHVSATDMGRGITACHHQEHAHLVFAASQAQAASRYLPSLASQTREQPIRLSTPSDSIPTHTHCHYPGSYPSEQLVHFIMHFL
jgi:hypothetical protein